MTSDKPIFSKKEVLGTIFSVFLGGFFLFFAFRGISFPTFLETMKQASVFWIIVFGASTMFAHVIRAYRWKVILRRVKPDVSIHHTFAAVMLGYGINNAVPRLGEVSRALFLGRYEGISRMSILGTIVVERILDMLFFGLAVFISGLIYTGDIYTKFPWLKATSLVGLVGMTILIVCLVVFVRNREQMLPIITKQVSHFSPKAALRIEGLLGKLADGFLTIRGTRTFIEVFILSALTILNYALTSLIGFYMIGIQNIMPATFAMAWITMSISSIGVLIPTPGGIGSYHTITKAILVTLFGISTYVSIAYAVLSHGISYVLSIIFAVIYFFAFRKRYGKIENNSLFNEDVSR